MAKRKSRTEIPREVAARVLFLSDRICCVCRVRGKPVQIHHIDEALSNNSLENLAVLCFDCHRETQIRGGFDRKLDADQVILFRDDWYRLVTQQRAVYDEYMGIEIQEESERLELVTSLAEIYRENQQFELLAVHYHSIGNYDLRDKYIELAIRQTPDDDVICFLRGRQGRPELIPEDTIEREIARHTKDKAWEQRARLYNRLGRYREAVEDYSKGISESLEANKVFSAAYYLKELVEEGLIQELFVIAFRAAEEENDLWWQVRALQELEWRSELRDFVLQHANEIEDSGNPMLLILLADARGDREQYVDLRKSIARGTRSGKGTIWISTGEEPSSEQNAA